ncbi:DUF3443 family protein [Pararobbsia silviterrae]|uniref:DUF3443 family protein n=1 Tax=Pararobbsia silviterrae TaxID=1792498 RepID=A0A494X155_9BURK|nr:DUF3443 family protein [Pararobbsia silviterrae]RKP44457.1 DUF3443 family protein [Pararobbsia silviterrae]
MSKFTWLCALASVCVALTACGGGGGSSSSDSASNGTNTSSASGGTAWADATATPTTSSATNAIPITIAQGPYGAVNFPLVTVTICAPNSNAATACASIPNVLLDTGSFGLRLFGSAINSANSSTIAALTQQTSGGNPASECSYFGSGFTWGTIRNADIKLSSEIASNVPIQVITDPTSTAPTAPGGCQVSSQISVPSDLGANGILGVSVTEYDNLGDYYACNGTNCSTYTPASNSVRITNPVALFPTDNNGVIVEIKQIADSGAASDTGTLVFGIDTESNNVLNGTGATTFTTDDYGNLSATFNGRTYSGNAFFDSGSNGIFFPDSSLPTYGDWYAPSATVGLSTTLISANSTSATINFNIGDAQTFYNSDYYASNNLGGPMSGTMDLGLSFFYGRHVYYGIVGKSSTGGGTGPYVSYVSN